MRNFDLLTANDIECRVSQINEKGLSLLLYKTARTDYAMLDAKFGMFGWQNDYRLIDGKMYCGIGVRNPETGEWVWKWNVGTESNTEAEKGQASDAMKRAGFAFGIGTELYSSPFIWIPAELCNIQERKGKLCCNDRFYVKSIGYNEQQDISELQIVNGSSGATVFTHPRKKTNIPRPDLNAEAGFGENPTPYAKPTAPIRQAPKPQNTTGICVACGATVNDKVRDYSVKKFGQCFCMDCQKKYAR